MRVYSLLRIFLCDFARLTDCFVLDIDRYLIYTPFSKLRAYIYLESFTELHLKNHER